MDALQISIDIGGTFTDLVIKQSGKIKIVCKSPSNPVNHSDGVLQVLSKASGQLNTNVRSLLSSCKLFILGTTSATNTMLELKGAKLGLICTAGFRDDLIIRRGFIPREIDFRMPFPEELVPRRLRLSVEERIDSNGKIVKKLVEKDVLKNIKLFKDAEVDSIAVSLFNSYLNPIHEKRIYELLLIHLPKAHVSISSDILPVLGEYPRISTTAINAYIAPKVLSQLDEISNCLKESGLTKDIYIMQNNGGIINTDLAKKKPVLMLLSGPAAGAAGTRKIEGKNNNFILFDMGGTSTDITIIRKDLPLITDEFKINGYDVFTPAIDVHTIATGGGATAWIDDGGMPHVGPKSAGAVPGPVSLGKGGSEITVTDANLLLGRLESSSYFGGEIPLYSALASKAISPLATKLNLTEEKTALGLTQIAEANMASAIYSFCIRKGVDPRKFILISAGGAGGLHAVAIAIKLGISKVYVPKESAVFCASGMLQANLERDFVKSFFRELNSLKKDELLIEFEYLHQLAINEMGSPPWPTDVIRFEYNLAIQYQGQQSQIQIPINTNNGSIPIASIEEKFHQAHEDYYGHRRSKASINIIRIGLKVVGELSSKKEKAIANINKNLTSQRKRMVGFHTGEWYLSKIYNFDELNSGFKISGPAVIESIDSTIMIPPRTNATYNKFGTIVIDVNKIIKVKYNERF